MADKEKKSGCLSAIFKAFAALVVFCVVVAIVASKNDKAPAGFSSTSATSNAPPKPTAEPRPSTPMAEPLPNLATVTKGEWPKEVRLRQAVKFTSAAGSVSVPAGTLVKLSSLSGETTSLDFQDTHANARAQDTDVSERIRDARQATREAAIAKQKAEAEAARLAAAKAARDEAERKAVAEATRKKLEAEIGRMPILGGWEKNEPPYIVKSNMKRVLKDPDSVQYIEASEPTVTQLDGQKCWTVVFRYRAKNSFGGYVVDTAVAYILNDNLISLKNLK